MAPAQQKGTSTIIMLEVVWTRLESQSFPCGGLGERERLVNWWGLVTGLGPLRSDRGLTSALLESYTTLPLSLFRNRVSVCTSESYIYTPTLVGNRMLSPKKREPDGHPLNRIRRSCCRIYEGGFWLFRLLTLISHYSEESLFRKKDRRTHFWIVF